MTEIEAPSTPSVKVISDVIFSQIMSVMGLKHPNWIARFLFVIFHSPIERMSQLIANLDENTEKQGFGAAVLQLQDSLVTNPRVQGEETIPKEGPLLVICNHPAAYDVVIVAAAIHRDDHKILGSDIPLVRLMPNVSEHLIPVPYDIPSRLQTVRSVIQHLKNGGAILTFPRGDVEPDPAVSPGAEQSLSGWSPSIELFLRRVPQTISVVVIASGMLSEKWFKNPLIHLWKKYEQRQKVAEIFQVAAQLLTGKKPNTNPKVSFSAPLTMSDLGGEDAPEGALLASLIEQARCLLADHPHI